MLMQYKFFYLRKSLFSLACLTCLSVLFYPSLSKAGFEWTPPAPVAKSRVEPVTPPQQPAGPLTPELSQEQDSNLPVPVGNVEKAPVPPPVEQPVVVAEPEQKPVPVPVVAPVATEVKQFSDFPIVEGFGKDIPLAVALRDIVPTHYAYVFSPSYVAGTKISWRGGQPWPIVLQNALAQKDLDSVVSENQLKIFSKQDGVPSSAPVLPPQTDSDENISDPLPLVDTAINADAPVVAPQDKKPLPVVDLKSHQKWSARPGTTLRDTLESWAKIAGTEVNWSTPYDYPINNAFYFEGNFSDAVDSLLSSYGGESPAPKGRLYPNLPDGPSVLMIN